jgi:hypothetical protein
MVGGLHNTEERLREPWRREEPTRLEWERPPTPLPSGGTRTGAPPADQGRPFGFAQDGRDSLRSEDVRQERTKAIEEAGWLAQQPCLLPLAQSR